MRTTTTVITMLSEDDVVIRISNLMANNGFLIIPGIREWNRGDGTLIVLRGLNFQLQDNTLTIETWMADANGEMGIDDERVNKKIRKQFQAILDVVIKALKAPNTIVEGYEPVVSGKEAISRNFYNRENSDIKYNSNNQGSLVMAIIALVMIVIGWILIVTIQMVYFYFPAFSIIMGSIAIRSSSGNKDNGKYPAVLTISIITIVLSALAVLMIF